MIVGLPRSGTTLVYELIVQAFMVGFLTRLYSYAYGAPNIATRIVANKIRDPYARYSSNYGRISGRYAPAENSIFWDRWVPEDPVLGHFIPASFVKNSSIKEANITLASMSAIAERPYVFKNIYMALALPAFLRLQPEAKILVVRRNIQSIVASVYKGRKSRSAWWSIRPPFATEMDSRDIFEQTVFQCARSKQILDRAIGSMAASQYMIADYEHICEAPQDFLDKVAAWTGTGFERRSNSVIPERFRPSKGPGIPSSLTQDYIALTDSLKASDEKYWARIESYVAERQFNARS
jgi:hypothetical protein